MFAAIIDDYNKLMSVYKTALKHSKTKAETNLLHGTFGAYLDMIKNHPSLDKFELYKELNEIYCQYYNSYLYNIKRCSKKNFDVFRDVVCDLLDKYGPPRSNSRLYYIPVEYKRYKSLY
jgi:hypothetical protein